MKVSNPALIISELEYKHGLNHGMLASKDVSKFLSSVRKKAIVKLRVMGLSYPEIGAHLKRDHSSIMGLVGARRRPVNKKGKASGKRGK